MLRLAVFYKSDLVRHTAALTRAQFMGVRRLTLPLRGCPDHLATSVDGAQPTERSNRPDGA